MQEYLLGEELKELYGHFIGKYYQPSEVLKNFKMILEK